MHGLDLNSFLDCPEATEAALIYHKLCSYPYSEFAYHTVSGSRQTKHYSTTNRLYLIISSPRCLLIRGYRYLFRRQLVTYSQNMILGIFGPQVSSARSSRAKSYAKTIRHSRSKSSQRVHSLHSGPNRTLCAILTICGQPKATSLTLQT